MKACPSCGRLYPEDAGFCPVEGAQLSNVSQAPLPVVDGDGRIGAVLSERYQVRRVVADGAMGRVYEALDLSQGRNVALKILHADVARDPVQVERFRREFDVSGLLPHQHIVDVHDFQPTSDGSYALVMEFLYGEELSSKLAREGVLHPGRVVRMLSQMALGLDEAHLRKLVHRDLKPDNVFLCQTPAGDMVKVLDFGSVKDKAEGAKKLTVMGTTIGSPFYMAPEQAQGLDTLDHRADVWALAAITYECITGRVPFQGANGPMILLEILTKEAPAPSRVAAGQTFPVPPTVDPVIARAFRKSAAVRTPTAGAFADQLGHAYGLSGSHSEWAYVPEQELAASIEARMDELLRASPAEHAADAADDFFGEFDSLGTDRAPIVGGEALAAPTKAVASDPMAQAMALAEQQAEADLVAAGLAGPSRGVSLALVGALVAVCLLVAFLVLL